MEDRNCLFCKEEESVNHLFIGCVVAQQLWVTLSKVFDAQLGGSLDSIGKIWWSNKCNGVLNMFTSAAVWSLWKLREMIYAFSEWRGGVWPCFLYKLAVMVQRWTTLCSQGKWESCSDQGSRWLSDVASELEAAFEQIRNRWGEKPGTSFSPQVAACVALWRYCI